MSWKIIGVGLLSTLLVMPLMLSPAAAGTASAELVSLPLQTRLLSLDVIVHEDQYG